LGVSYYFIHFFKVSGQHPPFISSYNGGQISIWDCVIHLSPHP